MSRTPEQLARHAEIQRRYRARNPERVKEINKKCKEKHKEEYTARHRARYKANKEMFLARNKVQSRKLKSRFTDSKREAKKRGIEWGLSFEEFCSFQGLPCAYCKDYRTPETRCGLDRLDSDLGYEIGNVCPCCTDCNLMKGNRFTSEEMHFIGHAVMMVKQTRVDKKFDLTIENWQHLTKRIDKFGEFNEMSDNPICGV